MMKQETKAKIKTTARKVGNAILTWAPWLALTTTICAAWDGYVTAERNSKELSRLKSWAQDCHRVVNHNADVQDHMAEDLAVLVDNHKELYDKALKETEGEETAA